MLILRMLVLLGACLTSGLPASAAQVIVTRTPSPAPVSPAASPPPVSSPPPSAAYSQFVKTAKRQSGLIDVLQKEDEVYFDLGPAQFDHPYIIAPVLASGVGGSVFSGLSYPSFIVEFKRVGKRVLWVSLNTNYSAPPGSAARAALDISVADSVIASSPIVAENEEDGHVIIGCSFFLTDFEGVGHDIAPEQAPASAEGLSLSFSSRPSFTVDSTKSYVERVKALPKNVEFLVSLGFNGPVDAVVAAPDPRGVVVKMHYSILDLPPASGYVPRLADDRVGYFIAAQKHFDNDNQTTPFVRRIERWNLDNGPITYYLSNEIPSQYRPVVRRALLEWNKAFAAIGYPHAVEVKDQPDDPNWDPDDIRYSTIRWVTSEKPAFAGVASWVVNPLSGEILRAEVVIDGEVLRSLKRGYLDQVAPARGERETASCAQLDCAYMENSAALAAAGSLSLGFGARSQAQRERYAEQWLQSVVLHESGHTFGLRHNFAGSTLYTLAQLHDPHFTAEHGLVSSVMEYTPVNLSPAGQRQADYFQLRLGPYDYWAIRYGYARFPGVKVPQDEAHALGAIAAESTRPEYAYGTDEDAEIWLGPDALDPMISTFDLSRDPLAFDANQFAVADGLVRGLDRSYPRDGRPYYEERQAFLTIMQTYSRAAQLATKYIGGIYTSRAHRGQPGARAPFRAISRAQQQRAYDLLARHVFSHYAFRFPPSLLNDLGGNQYVHWDLGPSRRPDFPISDFVAGLQDQAINRLFYPDVMMRIADEQLKVARPGETMSLADLFGWTQAAIWDDVGAPSIDPLQRNLQRRWTSLLIAFALAPTALIERLGYPDDASALARFELSDLAPRLEAALSSRRLDVPTQAHLADVAHRVNEALRARSVQGE